MDTHLTDFSSGCAVTEWLICFYLNRNAQLRAQRLPKEALSRSGILAISHEDLSEITTKKGPHCGPFFLVPAPNVATNPGPDSRIDLFAGSIPSVNSTSIRRAYRRA